MENDVTANVLPTAGQQADSAPQNRGGAREGAGAPAGNCNSLKHGLRGALTLGSVPKRMSYVRKIAGRFRREVEAAALDVHGTLGLYELALCQSSTRHELRCLFATRMLREGGDSLPLAERLKLLDVLGSATDSRDKCLQRLKLDGKRDDRDLWAVVDARSEPLASGEAEHSPKQGNALAAATEPDTGVEHHATHE